jgi:hypothetical protein
MTKAQEAALESMVQELTTACKAAHDRIDELTSLNAALTLRVISLETKAEPNRSKGGITETKAGLLNKVPMNAQVSSAGQNEDGSWYIVLDGKQIACTEYCGKWWKSNLAPKKPVADGVFAKINAEKQRLLAAGQFDGSKFAEWANAQLAA